MSSTSSIQSASFDLPPPSKRICTDSHTLSSQPHTQLPAPSNLPRSPLDSTHQPLILDLARHLRSLYKSRKLPPYGKWPPTPSKQFINMAVILKEKVSKACADEFTKATLRGNPKDDIFQTKEKIDFKHLAETKDGEPAQLVLVEGAPGIGKSTFAWEACRRWGIGEILQHYKLVVLLRLREKRVQQAKTIKDLFQIKSFKKAKMQEVTEEIENNQGAEVLLVLEGFDELPAHLRKEDSLFMDIIKGELLCNATILVTSRHWASRPLLLNDELHRPLSQHIEILGFTRKDIDDYLQCMTFDDPRLIHGLTKYLSCYPNIASMMYVPLNCAIVLEVYRESRSNEDQLIPKTMTQLYSSLVRTLLLRYLQDQPEYRDNYKKLERFDDLPDSVYEQFCELAKIAYEGICNDEQIIFSDLPDGFETLGLMHCVPELYIDQGAVVSYNFLHLTFQEFMAAVHVSLMTPNMQIEHFFSLEDSSMLLAFTAGLTKLDYEEDKLEKLSNSIDHKWKTPFFHWLFEAQNAKLLQGICKYIVFDNFKSDIGKRGPFDYYVLGYCVSHSNCNWNITLRDQFVSDETEMFVRGTANDCEDRCGKIVSLSLLFDDNNIPMSLINLPTCLLTELTEFELTFTQNGWNNLAKLLLRTPQLHELILEDCTFPPGCAVQLFESLSSLNSFTTLEMRHVILHNEVLHPEDSQALCGLLSTSRSLTKLGVKMPQPCSLSEYLIDGLNKSASLQFLDINDVELSSKDVESLSAVLQTNHTLLKLGAAYCNIDSIGAHHIAGGLNCNSTLRELSISYSGIGDDGATALAQVLISNNSLTALNLTKCSITEVGVSHLANALYVNSSLETLNLSYNDIKDPGAIALAQMLTRNQSLRMLGLIQCSITDGVSHLANALSVNSSLETLKLNKNAITDPGAIDLAQMLTKNRSLRKLKLKGCCMTEVGVSHLANALCVNSTLEKLSLDTSYASRDGLSALLQMLIKNPLLKERVQLYQYPL